MNPTNEARDLDLASRPPQTPALSDRVARRSVPSGIDSRLDLESVLRRCGPIPRAAAFLGVALDGLPVLLNLRDPSPGPLLISGDPGSGKRRLLQVVARFADLAHPSGEIGHVVLTDHTRDWEALAQSPHCEGVLPFHHPLTASYISALVKIGQAGRPSRPYLLLIVDGLDVLASETILRHDMLWLFQNGPTRGIWPIVTVNVPHGPGLAAWLQPFRTLLCSRTSGAALPLIPSVGTAHSSKLPPADAQFAMLSGDDWLPFWVPEPL